MTIDRIMRSACRKSGICLCDDAELPGRRKRSSERRRIASSPIVQSFGSPGQQKVTAMFIQRRQEAQRNTGTASNQGRYASNTGQLEHPQPSFTLPAYMPLSRQPANGSLVAPDSRICYWPLQNCLKTILRLVAIISLTLLATLCAYHLGKAVHCDRYTIVKQLNTFEYLARELLRLGYHNFSDFIAPSHWTQNRTMSEPAMVIGPRRDCNPQHLIPTDSLEEVNDMWLAISGLESKVINISQSLTCQTTAGNQQVNTPVSEEESLAQRLSEVAKQELVKVSAKVERLSFKVEACRQVVHSSSLKSENALRMLTERLEQLHRKVALSQSQSQAEHGFHKTVAPSTTEADNLPDFALASAGASVISTRKTQPYRDSTSWWQWWWELPNLPGPSIVLTPTVQLGSCWAFVGFPGRLVVKLSHPIHVSAISIDHPSRQQSYRNSLDSAPRELVIYALNHGCESTSASKKLGDFSYTAAAGTPTQTFHLAKPTQQVYKYIELVILSNHGNLEYTCLYRFRVHGHMD